MNKKLDLIVVALIFLISILYSFVFKDFYIGKALWVGAIGGIPSVIYLGIREKKNWIKIGIATIIFGGIFGFFFEFLAELNNSYEVIERVFPRIFGVMPLDNVLGHVMMALLTFTFYQHFIKRDADQKMSRFVNYALILGAIFVCLELVLFFINPQILNIHYEYAMFGSLALIPVVYIAIRRPWNIPNILKLTPYFFIQYFIVEISAISNSWWAYPGQYYLGWVSVFGLRFPAEELFFWMIFYAPFLVACYELFLEPRNRK